MAVVKRRRATPEEVAREGSAPWESDGDDGNPGDDCGGWLAGLLHDWTGSYRAAFIGAVAVNILHVAIAGLLLRRARQGL